MLHGPLLGDPPPWPDAPGRPDIHEPDIHEPDTHQPGGRDTVRARYLAAAAEIEQGRELAARP